MQIVTSAENEMKKKKAKKSNSELICSFRGLWIVVFIYQIDIHQMILGNCHPKSMWSYLWQTQFDRWATSSVNSSRSLLLLRSWVEKRQTNERKNESKKTNHFNSCHSFDRWKFPPMATIISVRQDFVFSFSSLLINLFVHFDFAKKKSLFCSFSFFAFVAIFTLEECKRTFSQWLNMQAKPKASPMKITKRERKYSNQIKMQAKMKRKSYVAIVWMQRTHSMYMCARGYVSVCVWQKQFY